MRLGCIWLTLLVLINNGTGELSEVELLDPAFDDLMLLQTAKSAGTSALQMELEGMMDANGRSIFAPNASDTTAVGIPKVSSSEVSAELARPSTKGDAGSVPAEKSGAVKYYSLDYMAVSEDASLITGVTLEHCQEACSGDPKCRSFTYKRIAKKCYTSQQHMQYDLDFTFKIKAQDPKGGEPKMLEIGPMKYSPSQMEQTTAEPGWSFDQCGNTCVTDDSCFSIAYRKRDGLCLISSARVEYDADAKYFEKQGVAEDMLVSNSAAESFEQPASSPQATEPKAAEPKLSIEDQASLTPEQAKYIALAYHAGAGDVKHQALQNALLGINVELKVKSARKIAEAQKRKQAAAAAAAQKAAEEAAYKNAEKKCMKESQTKLHETMEGDTKSAEKAAEAQSKAAIRAKETAEKEKERLKYSSGCERTQKAHEAADLKKAKLTTEMNDNCNSAKSLERETASTGAQVVKSIAKVKDLEAQQSTLSEKLVYVSEKTAVKAAEAHTAKIEEQLNEITKKINTDGAKISKLQEEYRTLSGIYTAAQTDEAKAKGALNAAELAVQGAAPGSELTLAKAAEAGASAALAKAESRLADAKSKASAVHSDLKAMETQSFKDKALQKRKEGALQDAKAELSAAQDQHFTDLSDLKLKLSSVDHELPRAKSTLTELEASKGNSVTALVKAKAECKKSTIAVSWQEGVLQEQVDKNKVCSDERDAKAAAKEAAEARFQAMRAAHQVAMAKKQEQEYANMLADAEIESKQATDMSAKADAGSKIADYQASKLQAESEVSRLIPISQNLAVAEAKAQTHKQSATAVVDADEKKVEEDEEIVAKDAKEEEQASPDNPSNIIAQARNLLDRLRETVGMAEVKAGEKDTTAADADESNASSTPGHDAVKQDLQKAEDAAQAGNTEKAAAEIKKAEKLHDQAQKAEEQKQQDEEEQQRQEKEEEEQENADKIVQAVKATAARDAANANHAVAKKSLAAALDVERTARAKELHSKAHIKQLNQELVNAEKQDQEDRENAQKIAGKWPLAGTADDVVGHHGSALLKSVTWEKDDTYGKCLSFDGPHSEVNLGTLGFEAGTISMWVRVNEAGEQQLFGPGMEVVSSGKTAHQSAKDAIDEAVEVSVRNFVPNNELGESASEQGQAAVSIQQDGGLAIFNGEELLSLSPAGTVPTGQWVQLAFVFTGKTVALNVNGSPQSKVECAHDYDTHPFIVGRGLQGFVQNVNFWKRALTGTELSDIQHPSSGANSVKFVAYSPEGQYKLAKAKSEDLSTRENAEKANMAAAEKEVKAAEKEKRAREVRDKNQMKAEKERRDELAAKDKANEAQQKDTQRETEQKERQVKSREDAEKEDAKSKETDQKNARKELLDKEEAKQVQEEQAAATERQAKAEQRKAQLDALKNQEKAQKQQEKNVKAAASNEKANKQKAAAAQAAQRQQADEAAAKEREQKAAVNSSNEQSSKEVASKAAVPA